MLILIWVRDSCLIPNGICVHGVVRERGFWEALLLLILFIWELAWSFKTKQDLEFWGLKLSRWLLEL
jgi:hypothetical protein